MSWLRFKSTIPVFDQQRTVQAVDRAVTVQALCKTNVEFQLNKYLM
jgi:hypothetical protein